jgi:hypothetical protein
MRTVQRTEVIGMSKTIDEYVRKIDALAAASGDVYEVTDTGECPPVWLVRYRDVPESGYSIAFTCGLSSVFHEEWRFGRPELLVCVNSCDLEWGIALGEVVRTFRAKRLFSIGSVFTLGDKIVESSGMDSFLMFVCTVLDEGDQQVMLEGRVINFVQAYPIYSSEIDLIRSQGAEAFFFDSGVDFIDVGRPPLQ